MSLYATAYYRREFLPWLRPPKRKLHLAIHWGEVAEPVNPYLNLEVALAAAEAMLESSRTYWRDGTWGHHGVTGVLLGESCVNAESHPLQLHGTISEVMARLARTFTIGLLTGHYGAARWRREKGIAMDKKVTLPGPFDGSNEPAQKAWARLCALEGKDIASLNESHPRATRLLFTGLQIRQCARPRGARAPASERVRGAPAARPAETDPRGEGTLTGGAGATAPAFPATRRWHLDFYVQYPREKFGSGWDLSFLRRPHDVMSHLPPEQAFYRLDDETAAEWMDRVADIVEKLVRPGRVRKSRNTKH